MRPPCPASPPSCAVPSPIKVEHLKGCELQAAFRDALQHQADESGFGVDEGKFDQTGFRIETYLTQDIVGALFGNRWEWPSYQQMEVGDQTRVDQITSLLSSGAPKWPYYSYWANTFASLWGPDDEDPDDRAGQHGAGWHRITAQALRGDSTVDLVFHG